MLQLTGKCLDVEREMVGQGSDQFESVTMFILDGRDVQRVRVGRDFPSTDLPKKDDDVILSVVVSAFSRRSGGAGVQMTALSRERVSGARVAAAV